MLVPKLKRIDRILAKFGVARTDQRPDSMPCFVKLNYKNTNTQDIYNVGCDDLNGTIDQVAQLIEKNIHH